MLDIKPESMHSGLITAISIRNENIKEIVEISPFPFDLFTQDSTKNVISRYYLRKKNCENLIQQLEMAQREFQEAKNEFDSLMHTSPEHEVESDIAVPPPESEKKSIPIKPKSPVKPPEPEPEPEPEPTPEPIQDFKPEPMVTAESIISAPAPSPPSLEEITTMVVESEELKILIENNQLSDTTIRSVILKKAPSEWEDTVHGMVIEQLKEKGIIEPSFFEKVTRKLPGRPKTKR